MTRTRNELKDILIGLTYDHGHSALVLELAEMVGWQGRYAASCHEKQIAKVAQMLAEAAQILEVVEAQQNEANENARMG